MPQCPPVTPQSRARIVPNAVNPAQWDLLAPYRGRWTTEYTGTLYGCLARDAWTMAAWEFAPARPVDTLTNAAYALDADTPIRLKGRITSDGDPMRDAFFDGDLDSRPVRIVKVVRAIDLPATVRRWMGMGRVITGWEVV